MDQKPKVAAKSSNQEHQQAQLGLFLMHTKLGGIPLGGLDDEK